MTSNELRQKYLEFFKSKEHSQIPSSSLVPDNDPTTLFISAGMQPLIPYLLGEPHPLGKRLTGTQKCLRTGDIDEVGDTTHHTFFEMLGNWSLGDYFKKEAIEWSFEFLTTAEGLGIPKEKLAVSVFAGDTDAPFDEESYNHWISLGIAPERIAKLPKKNNWWGPAGETGPCGPDTEMFYWTAQTEAPKEFNPEDPNWVEIWNDVFMQYSKNADGKFEKLSQQNVDTGMGLERALAVLSGTPDNYQTELFLPIIKVLETETGTTYNEHQKEFRIIADHIKASVFLIKDGVLPSNKLQGYVLRRLIRRASVKLHFLKPNSMDLLTDLVSVVVDIYKNTDYFYPETDIPAIKIVLQGEIDKFKKSLNQGLKEIEKIEHITSKEAFDLYQTHGFPIEITAEIFREKGQEIDMNLFTQAFEEHKNLSRTTSAGIFKGGLADHSEQTTKLHTATHLLQAAAKQILGAEVGQRGSNITAERLRWDFNYPQRLTDEQIKKLEELVNQKIKEGLSVWFDIEDRDTAIKNGATTNFGETYPDKVKVYKMGLKPPVILGNSPREAGEVTPESDSGQARVTNLFSIELCGGPHVENTSTLKSFKIIKEESAAAGIRRIYAVVE